MSTVKTVVKTIDDVPTLAHRCRTSAVIARPLEVVYQALYDMRAWPQHLPHVQEIEVRYDDGQYQEFLMAVQSDERYLRVRSVRNCQENLIEWFQPEPPDFLAHHGGTWRFRSLPDGSTEITATHAWNLDADIAPRAFMPTASRTTEQQVYDLLLGHAELAIGTWRRVLEAATPATSGR